MIPDESYHQPYHCDRPDRILRLATRAWRAIIKWPGVVVAGLLTALCAGISGVALLGLYRLYLSTVSPTSAIQLAGSPSNSPGGVAGLPLRAAIRAAVSFPWMGDQRILLPR